MAATRRVMVVARKTRRDRQLERARIGPLRTALISDRTLSRYARAFLMFTSVVSLTLSSAQIYEDLDAAMADFVGYLGGRRC